MYRRQDEELTTTAPRNIKAPILQDLAFGPGKQRQLLPVLFVPAGSCDPLDFETSVIQAVDTRQTLGVVVRPKSSRATVVLAP